MKFFYVKLCKPVGPQTYTKCILFYSSYIRYFFKNKKYFNTELKKAYFYFGRNCLKIRSFFLHFIKNIKYIPLNVN